MRSTVLNFFGWTSCANNTNAQDHPRKRPTAENDKSDLEVPAFAGESDHPDKVPDNRSSSDPDPEQTLQDADQPPPDNIDFTFGPVLARMSSQQGSGAVTPHESSTSQAADSVSGHDTARDTTSQHSESSGRLHGDSVSGVSSPDLRSSTRHSLPSLVRSQPNMFLGEGSVITPVFRMIMQQIQHKMQTQHEEGLVFNELNPTNILITPRNTSIFVQGGSETITDAGRNTEVAALGRVIYFICTAGRHGETWQPTCRVCSELQHMPLVADLVANVLRTRPSVGPSLSYVMQHPAWWTAEEFKHFSAEALTFLGKDPQGLSRQLQQCYESLVEGSDWRDTIEPPLMHYMETESSAYWDASLRDLLRFMKNSSKHEDKVNLALRGEDSMQELLQHGAFRYFEVKFFKVLILVHKFLLQCPDFQFRSGAGSNPAARRTPAERHNRQLAPSTESQPGPPLRAMINTAYSTREGSTATGALVLGRSQARNDIRVNQATSAPRNSSASLSQQNAPGRFSAATPQLNRGTGGTAFGHRGMAGPGPYVNNTRGQGAQGNNVRGQGAQDNNVRGQSAQGNNVWGQGPRGINVPSPGPHGSSVPSQGPHSINVPSPGPYVNNVQGQGAQGNDVYGQAPRGNSVPSQGPRGINVPSPGLHGINVTSPGPHGTSVRGQAPQGNSVQGGPSFGTGSRPQRMLATPARTVTYHHAPTNSSNGALATGSNQDRSSQHGANRGNGALVTGSNPTGLRSSGPQHDANSGSLAVTTGLASMISPAPPPPRTLPIRLQGSSVVGWGPSMPETRQH